MGFIYRKVDEATLTNPNPITNPQFDLLATVTNSWRWKPIFGDLCKLNKTTTDWHCLDCRK